METVINNKKFVKRLQKVMDDNQLSATAFAERLDIGRATISHLMSGRNKPSLDFVMKVVSVFKTVDLHWLIYGEVNPKKQVVTSEINEFDFNESDIQKTTQVIPKTAQDIPKITQEIPVKEVSHFTKMTSSSIPIKRIILCMEDGTFESYEL